MIVRQIRTVVEGKGGSDGVSIPAYADRKIIDWFKDAKGDQVMVQNGTQVAMIDPAKVPTSLERLNRIPFWRCVDGRAFFTDDGKWARVWFYDDEVDDWVLPPKGKECWLELSHLAADPVGETEEPGDTDDPGETPAEPYQVIEVDFTVRGTIKFRR